MHKSFVTAALAMLVSSAGASVIAKTAPATRATAAHVAVARTAAVASNGVTVDRAIALKSGVNADVLDLTAISGATTVQNTAVGSPNTVDPHSISWFVDATNNQTIVYVNTTGTANHVDMEIHLTGSNINLSGSDILHHT